MPPLQPLAYAAWEGHIPAPEEAVEGMGPTEGVRFHPLVMLVMEVPDPNIPGPVIRQHQALPFKEIKAMKEAVCSYGPPGTVHTNHV